MDKHFKVAVDFLKSYHDTVDVINVVHDFEGNEIGFMLKIPYSNSRHIREDGVIFNSKKPAHSKYVRIGQTDDSKYAYLLKRGIDFDNVDWEDAGFYN